MKFNNAPKFLSNQKGSALVITLFFVIIVAMLGAVISLRSSGEAWLSQGQANSSYAFWVAEGGIQKAYWLITKSDCVGLKNQGTSANCAACASCGPGNLALSENFASGSYAVVISNGNKKLNSTGTYSPNSFLTTTRQIEVILGSPPLFGYAAFSRGQMTFSNNAKVDSYNSTQGAYGGTNVSSQGNIGTMSAGADAIVLNNNVTIKGSVTTGEGGGVQQGSGVTITGTVSDNNDRTLTVVTVPPELLSAASLGPLTFSNGDTKNLSAGKYRYDSIGFANNGELVISGDVVLYLTSSPAIAAGNNNKVTINTGGSLKIYTDGAIAFNNNVLLNNATQDPSKFSILSRYSGSDGVVISNNGNFYGTIYAPDAGVNVSNNAQVYGAIVGSAVNVSNNDQVHYDLALGAIDDTNAAPVLRNWREVY
ncbi:MAG: hypothetical protein HQL16_08095 [Candidatus Omnitrophica bacterium]|nr:hypothetical protein [Candidatus Omnitrophota bacterium]